MPLETYLHFTARLLRAPERQAQIRHIKSPSLHIRLRPQYHFAEFVESLNMYVVRIET
jgi:hypothetical protein